MAVPANLLASGAHLPPFHMALAYVGLGDHEEAFRWLARAREEREEREPWLYTINIDRTFDPLRVDSRFGDLVWSIGLVP